MVNKPFGATLAAVLSLSSIALAEDQSIHVKEVGSYYVGGKTITVSGLSDREIVYSPGSPPTKINPNGEFLAGQMYVHYTRLEDPKGKYPLLLWHGGGMTGVNWETKPDGKPGWEMYFLRQGWDVYTSDAVERGRATWAQYPAIYKTEPFFRTKKEAWELFRFGAHYDADPAKTVAAPGTQFPVEAFDEFVKQGVPRWTSNDEITQQAYDQYVEKQCPCVIVVHSQGGNFAYNAALQHPDKIKAMVMVETSGSPDPDKTDFAPLKNVPMLWVWGDHTGDTPFWRTIVERQERVRAALDRVGNTTDVIVLPKLGITGNSHMMMMDRNSDQVAGLINDWLVKRDLSR